MTHNCKVVETRHCFFLLIIYLQSKILKITLNMAQGQDFLWLLHEFSRIFQFPIWWLFLSHIAMRVCFCFVLFHGGHGKLSQAFAAINCILSLYLDNRLNENLLCRQLHALTKLNLKLWWTIKILEKFLTKFKIRWIWLLTLLLVESKCPTNRRASAQQPWSLWRVLFLRTTSQKK